MRLLLCGLGAMGSNHLRILHELGDCEVVGIVEPNRDRHKARSVQPTDRLFADLEHALGSCQPDAVLIATPTSTHHALSRSVLERGLPLFIEKPIARTAEQAEDLVALAAQRKLPLMVGHIERFNPAVVAARKLLKNGDLGEPLCFSARRVGGTPRDIDGAGDLLIDLAVHDLDLATWLLGEPHLHSAVAHQSKRMDSATMLFHAGRTIIDVHVNWVTPVKVRELRITGTLGHLDVNLITQEVVWYKRNPILAEDKPGQFFFDDYMRSFASPERLQLIVEQKEPLREELLAFIDALRTGAPMPVSGEDGLLALRLVEQARKVIEA